MATRKPAATENLQEATTDQPEAFRDVAKLADLKPHSRNYRTHTPGQLDHLKQSIREHGLYRNIVVARDNTILAGHGVVQAARELGFVHVPIVQLNIEPDDPRALKVLIGDNQIYHLAEIDDRQLTDMLKEISASDVVDLLGTGYDAQQLAAHVMVTRSANEIRDRNVAGEWVGMPEYEPTTEAKHQIIVNCATEADRDAFLATVGAKSTHIVAGRGKVQSIWWPLKERAKAGSQPVFEG